MQFNPFEKFNCYDASEPNNYIAHRYSCILNTNNTND